MLLDEHYVQHASLFLDLSILVRTFGVMFRGEIGEIRNEEVIAAALAEKWGRGEFAHAPKDASARAIKTAGFIRTATISPTADICWNSQKKSLIPENLLFDFDDWCATIEARNWGLGKCATLQCFCSRLSPRPFPLPTPRLRFGSPVITAERFLSTHSDFIRPVKPASR
jgi:hypothetical protein